MCMLRDIPGHSFSEFFIDNLVLLVVYSQAWQLWKLLLCAGITSAGITDVDDLAWPSRQAVSCALRRDWLLICHV